MEGLAGERKRWPLLINQRETLPKSPIHNLTMEITTEQNLEWNMGGVTAETGQKKKFSFTVDFIFVFLFHSISNRPSVH